MRDYFFQIVLFLLGIIITFLGQQLPARGQRLIAFMLAVVLIAVSLLWAGYEMYAASSANSNTSSLPTGNTNDGQTTMKIVTATAISFEDLGGTLTAKTPTTDFSGFDPSSVENITKQILGSWTANESSFIFHPDGTYNLTRGDYHREGGYFVKDNVLTLYQPSTRVLEVEYQIVYIDSKRLILEQELGGTFPPFRDDFRRAQ